MIKYSILHKGRISITVQRTHGLSLLSQQRHHLLCLLRINKKITRKYNYLEYICGLNSFKRYLLLNIVIASTASYPFIVIRTVMFDHRGPDNVLKFMDVSRHVMKDHGFIGFYAGLKPDLIRLIPSNAIVFIIY